MRSVVSFAVMLLLTGSLYGKNLQNIDAFGAGKNKAPGGQSLAQKAGNLLRSGSRIQEESRLGVPTFLWLNEGALSGRPQPNGPERPEIAAARGHLAELADVYNLAPSDVANAVVDMVMNTGRGPVIVKFRQQIDGVDIFREEINVVMNQQLAAIAVTGYITSQTTPAAQPGQSNWTIPAAAAATNALRDAALNSIDGAQLVKSFSREGHDFYTFSSPVPGVVLEEPVRMKRVWFHVPDGLIPAYFVEVITNNATGEVMLDNQFDESAYAYAISAVDGSILFRKNLIDHASGHSTPANALPPGGFTYRVWADPVTGIPYDTPAGNGVHPKLVPLPDGGQHAFVPSQDVQLPNYPFSMNDPWLAPGATETNGNNADAYVNLVNAAGNADNGYGPVMSPIVDPPTGDHRALTTGTDQFLHNFQPDVDAFSSTARQGSITQLFYNINFMHDWYYDSGFTEAARNGQKNNFGRGGLQNDDIKSQVQDTASFNNANMLTPSDGTRPRMRMYNFPNLANTLHVQAPAGIAGKLRIGISQTGVRNFDINSDIVIATFSNSPSACTITNAAALAGKIAMFDFDNTDGTGCAFGTRVTRIHATGALAALMVYSSAPANVNLVANITGLNATHTKPIAVISWNSAAPIKTQLAGANTVTARLLRVADRDGAFDNQIVFHEWGHFISNRLIGNALGLNNQQGGAMGEGWGDFNAMMLTVRAEDTLTASNSTWGGAYAIATYATSGVPFDGSLNHGYYLGIRRTPYSTDMANYNALTLRHIVDGEPLPTGPPIATGGVNSQVHNSGEVWATMLWECYAALLRDTQGPMPRLTFQQAQDRMKQYLVASLAMTPNSPTYLEARDAVLTAAYATDITDYLLFWQAFAKRGAGLNAIAADRFSTNHVGTVENFDAMPEIRFVSTSLDDSVANCDADGTLDSGETGKLTVTFKNVGTATLSNTIGTVSSTTPGVTFPSGTIITFPASDPLATVTGSINVAYAAGISGIQQIDFQVDVYDPTLGGTRTATPGFRANVTSIPATSATDSVEAYATPWTTDSDLTLSQVNPWTRAIVVPLDREWHVDDPNAASDQRLVSPVFTVGGSGSVNVQFDHTWSFEFDASANYDGGVIEMQVDGGAWTDIGGPAAGPNYNGTLINYSGNLNPLKTRPAFVKTGSAHTSITQAVAPGSTVRIRFRFGSDNSAGAPGWFIDNIAFTGVIETPFGTVTGDAGCSLPTATALTTSANPSPFGSALTLTATVTAAQGTPSGNVTFFDGATNLGTVALNGSGVATLITSALTVGPHSLTASYAGGPGFLASNSAALAQTISKIATALALISSANPANIGDSVTFTATVTATTGTPTGSVTFLDGATPLGSSVLTGGVATFTTSALAGGSHTINATYAGTSTYASSANALSQNIVTGSTIAFNPIEYWKFEDGGTVTLTVTRTGGNTTGAASVQYATASGTALSGIRFAADSGTIHFAGGETSKLLTITLLDTSAIEGKQTFTVTLSNPNAAVLGAAVATVNVMDDDAGRVDFSSPLNGTNDIVWRNEATGDTKVYKMNGTTFDSSSDLLQFGGNWRYAAAADFNADGNADILYRNAVDGSLVVWYMSGTSILGTGSVPGTSDLNWKLVAVGDISGDGYPDLLWRHATTYTMAVWTVRNNAVVSVYTLPSIPDANWSVKGLGDFNRDNQLDIVWHHSGTRTVALWYLAPGGLTRASTGTVTPTTGAPWELVGVADMNADGDSDLLWQASTTRTVVIGLMNQNTRSSVVVVSPTISDPNWNVVGPR
ncbi:MAG TPA: M36 family metallopeptidase [Thermoanaerobaculia bacterium]|nr:M36 family metallopeptidase [Thermoanaerobaculia bacterium]